MHKIYVVEDMAISRAALISLLEECQYKVVGSAANAEKAWTELQHLDVDLVLLDINLAGKNNGIWLAKKIRSDRHIAIVFLTAYGDTQTIAKLTSVDPNGYLMKPYNQPTLLTTINIALKSFTNLKQETITPGFEMIPYIIEVSGQKIKIFLDEIQHISSDGNYIELHFLNKKHVIRSSLKQFLELIPKNDFLVQSHLRFAINIKKVDSIDINCAYIQANSIPISKTYRKGVTIHFSN